MPIRNQSLGDAADEDEHDKHDAGDAAKDQTAQAPEADSGANAQAAEIAAAQAPPPDEEEVGEGQGVSADGLPALPPKMPGGGRIRARMAAVQAIYQWRMSGTEIGELIIQFATAGRLRDLDRAYFEMLIRGVVHDVAGLEQAFDTHLSRPAVQLDPVEYAILLLASYELRECPEIPFAAVINEATNLAKIFGATDGHRFVNGVMDAVARDLRGDEMARSRRGPGA
ncbi:transcription antitermination factor NusB [uncultured Salinisphaera sp.]|uniref:transcription antitermination factor NusB n=1 Tax=uncultured Salinisphaera sp. TaxID=359372 RepID=UPI0032B2CDAE|tara:strand:+ start:681 stop:1358 length:678 start_codon:yes stop_codon:yes gene_type:complete